MQCSITGGDASLLETFAGLLLIYHFAKMMTNFVLNTLGHKRGGVPVYDVIRYMTQLLCYIYIYMAVVVRHFRAAN